MKGKKVIFLVLMLVITIAVLGSSWIPVAAAKTNETVVKPLVFEKPADIYLRKGGVYFSSSNYTGEARLTRFQAVGVYLKKNLEFVQPLTEIRANSSSGVEFKTLWGIVYVYYNLTSEQRAAWTKGDLSIYQYDPIKKTWSSCPSLLVQDESTKFGRLACVIPAFGVYGLASSN